MEQPTFLYVIAPSGNSFRLDNHWVSQELRCDWEAEYQEPGVEAELNFEFLELYHYIF